MDGTDGVLVGRVLAGDQAAFNALAHRWQKPLYNFAYRYTGQVEEAEDVCQEALSRAYSQLGRLKDPERFGSWLTTIAYRLCQDRGRRRGRRVEVSTEEMAESGADPTAHLLAADMAEAAGGIVRLPLDPTVQVEVEEIGQLLRRALLKLPEEQRVALVLREYQGYSAAEIGRMLDVPVPTIRSRIFYGLKSLRRLLGRGPLGQELSRP
jgi:RNA polymerase sigma-70 factor (ECF subfamily)